MYKLLLVSDRQEVLDAFAQVDNWELLGFRPPHIRHDFEGAVDSLKKHFCDGISLAVPRQEEEKILAYLRKNYPLVSIFEAGKTPQEVVHYLEELRVLLNRLHADFSEDEFNRLDMLQMCRHEFLRKVVAGQVACPADLYRNMRLLRSRMDPDRICALVQLEQPSVADDRLEGRWEYGPERMELTLVHSFGGDCGGYHFLPMVYPDGSVLVLVGPLREAAPENTPEEQRKQGARMRQEYYEKLTDDQLIELSREQDERAAETLMSRYKGMVRRRARSMFILGGDSEDLIQEGMLGLFKALRDYDCGRDASFSTFASLCVSRQLYTAVRASGRKKHMPLNTALSLSAAADPGQDPGGDAGGSMEEAVSAGRGILSAPGYGENPEKVLIDRESLMRLQERIETELSPFEKQVLDLYLTGMNYVEIARILNREEKSTDNALQRIRAKVRKWKE